MLSRCSGQRAASEANPVTTIASFWKRRIILLSTTSPGGFARRVRQLDEWKRFWRLSQFEEILCLDPSLMLENNWVSMAVQTAEPPLEAGDIRENAADSKPRRCSIFRRKKLLMLLDMLFLQNEAKVFVNHMMDQVRPRGLVWLMSRNCRTRALQVGRQFGDGTLGCKASFS